MYSQSSGYLFLAWLTKEMMQSIKSHVSCPLWWSWTASSKLDSLEDWQLDKRHKFLPFYRKKLVVFWAQKLFLVCFLADKHKVVLRVVVMGGGGYEYNCGVVQWGSRATEMIWRVYSSAAFGQLDLFIFFFNLLGERGRESIWDQQSAQAKWGKGLSSGILHSSLKLFSKLLLFGKCNSMSLNAEVIFLSWRWDA